MRSEILLLRSKDMPSRASGHRSPGPALGSRISYVLLAMFATMASVYVAGRLWIDSESRVHLIKELDRRTGQGQSAVSVDDTLKVVACRDQHKKLSALEMELAVVMHEGFVGRYSSEGSGNGTRKKLMAVIGVATGLGGRTIRWLSSATVAAVTGSNRGIGFEIARQLAEHGLTVIVASRNPVQGRATADGLREQGLSVDSWQFDVSDAASVGSFAQWVVDKYGGLDILVPVFLPHFGLSSIPCNFKPDQAGLCCLYGEQFRQYKSRRFTSSSLIIAFFHHSKAGFYFRFVTFFALNDRNFRKWLVLICILGHYRLCWSHSEEKERVSLIQTYHDAFKGFSAMHTEKEAVVLSGRDGVVSVFRDQPLALEIS